MSQPPSSLQGASARVILTTGVFLLLAVLGCLWVWAANGGPLFYYDSLSYLLRGLQTFQQLGLIDQGNVTLLQLSSSGAEGAGGTEGAGTVDGSRSLMFSILVFLFALTGSVEWLLVFNAVITVGTIWVLARVVLRDHSTGLNSAQLVLIVILVCATGALPFYVAYLMPDLLAGLLILVAAILIGFGGKLTVWELLMLFCVGALATVTHLSHLALAGMAAILAIILVPLQLPGKRWIAPVMLVSFVALGIAEQATLRVAATVTQNSEVVYKPFLTARLIQDGPGLAYLDKNCPDDAIPTCALAEALKLSDDPWRLTATHIVFEKSPRLGSFRLMNADDQRKVALDQFRFFFAVLRDRPFETTLAILQNAFLQASMNSVDMTLQSDVLVQQAGTLNGSLSDGLDHGRLTVHTEWLAVVDPLQQGIYGISLSVILILILWPGAVDRRTRLYLIVICLGILGNALVCGGVSQPATRYGGRVIWLLQLSATVAIVVWLMRRKQTSQTSQQLSTSESAGMSS